MVASAADMSPSVLRTERLALVDLLSSLGPAQWATASLCRGWTVQDVAAHLAWTPAMPPLDVAVGMARSGLRPNRFIADSAVRWSTRGPTAILDRLRANAVSGARPLGVPAAAVFADAVIHQLDIRRPLHEDRTVPGSAFRVVADFFTGAGSRWPLTVPFAGSARRRVAGLTLVAGDQDWAFGEGPEVHASGETALLLLSGRRVAADKLSGPAAALLAERL
jgi:uncharacterized protein (TIGR03083 family)